MNEKIKQALENFKCIKEDLDYFQPKYLVCTNREEQYKSVENALNDFDRYYESQQDLIKGKDEYIAKLLGENKKAKENFVEMVTAKDKLNAEINNEKEELKEALNIREDSNIRLNEINIELRNERDNLQKHLNEKTLETHKLTQELNELRDFTQIVFNKNVFIWGMAYRKNEVKDYKPTYEYYKNNCGYFHSGYKFELMTETEFELVKKVVEKYGK